MFEHVTVVVHLIPWKVTVLYVHAGTLSSRPRIETPLEEGRESMLRSFRYEAKTSAKAEGFL